MKNQNYHYVVQLGNGVYWAGHNSVTDQIRKAQMYNSLKMAHSAAVDAVKRNSKCFADTRYRILKVEFCILEAEDWLTLE